MQWFLCFTSQNTFPTKETKAIQRKIKPLQKVSSWAWTSALVLCEAGNVTVNIIRFKSIAGGSCLIWKLQEEPVIRANIWTATLWHRKIYLQNSPMFPSPSCLRLIPRSCSTFVFPPGSPSSASLGHHTPWLPAGSLWSKDFQAPSFPPLLTSHLHLTTGCLLLSSFFISHNDSCSS